MIVFLSGSAMQRKNVGSYPIFSLRRDNPLLNAFRQFLAEQSVSFTEVSLPGAFSPELGFCIKRADIRAVGDALNLPDAGEVITALKEQWNGWVYTPHLTKVPDAINIPDDCLPDLKQQLEKAAARQIYDDITEQEFVVINPSTEEQTTVKIDYKNHTYFLADQSALNWKYWALVFNGK